MFFNFVKKLKNKRGGTMIVSMMYFLFASLVGGFMVTSTHSTTYRLTRLRQESQSFYDAKSAANIVTDLLSNMEYTFELWESIATSDNKIVYFLESIYPYPIKNGNNANNGKTYPVGTFKFNGKDTENNNKMSLFFEWLFSNHTFANITGSDNRSLKFNGKAYGNDLANMFVTTHDVWNAFPEVFPKDDTKTKNDIDTGTILSRLSYLYTDGSTGGINPERSEFYTTKSTADIWNAFERFIKNKAVNVENGKITSEFNTLTSVSTKTLLGNQTAKTVLDNIAKSTPGEYTFDFTPSKTGVNFTPDGFENFGSYNVKIRFESNKDTKLVNAQQVTADDLFICIVEIRRNATDVVPLYTMSSKCTLTADRSEPNVTTNPQNPVKIKVTMSWKDWQNVHVTNA